MKKQISIYWLPLALTILTGYYKLSGALDVSWLIVFLPLWLPWALILLILIIGWIIEKKN